MSTAVRTLFMDGDACDAAAAAGPAVTGSELPESAFDVVWISRR